MKKILLVHTAFFFSSCFSNNRPVSNDGKEPKMNVAILIYNGVQIIDYPGPYEVHGSWGGGMFFTVTETSEQITTRMGMFVTPNYNFGWEGIVD